MPRIRTIKPGFFRSHTIAELSTTARLTFIGLWTYCDDEGRGIDDARLIKGELWALDDKQTTRKVEDDLKALDKANLIERYVVDTRLYLRIRTWREHQVINRPQPSRIPPPVDPVLNPLPPFTDHSGNGHGTITDVCGEEVEVEVEKEWEVEGKRKDISPSPALDTADTDPTQEIATLKEEETRVFRWADLYVDKLGFTPKQFRATESLMRRACVLDDRVLDECLNYLAGLEDRPKTVRYVETALVDWAAQRGVAMLASAS